AEDLLDRCPPGRRGWEWQYLKERNHADLFTLRGHSGAGWAMGVACSPDGRLIASAGGGNPYFETQGLGSITPAEGILWDAATGARVRTLRGHRHLVGSVAFSPDGLLLASGSADGTTRLWDVATGRELRAFAGNGGGASPIAFSADGRRLVTGGSDRKVRF